MVKNLPGMQETRVRSPSWEGPLEKEIAIYSSILAWRMDRGAWQATVHRVAKSWSQFSDKMTTYTTTFSYMCMYM